MTRRNPAAAPTQIALSLGLSISLLIVGCNRPSATVDSPPPVDSNAADLRTELDEVLDFTLNGRQLNLDEHRAWQILHGVLAYPREFEVLADGHPKLVLNHVLEGGEMEGWTVEVVTREDGAKGLRALLEEGSKAGQGHADQWLAVLAQADLPLDQKIVVDDKTVTMADYLSQVQWDVPRNLQQEYSWTLIGLTAYLPTDATWQASDGKTWSIERLVASEAEQDVHSSACGGSHRLIGLTMALDKHRRKHPDLNEVWRVADGRIQEAITAARDLQNPDGSFSIHYFARKGSSPDLAQNLGATGHVLEFLALALDKDALQEEWVERAVRRLCAIFRKTREIDLECGALYHAAHGLSLYREKVYGPRAAATTD